MHADRRIHHTYAQTHTHTHTQYVISLFTLSEFSGNFRKNSCNYSPSSSPDVINVGGTQQAEDDPYPGM